MEQSIYIPMMILHKDFYYEYSKEIKVKIESLNHTDIDVIEVKLYADDFTEYFMHLTEIRNGSTTTPPITREKCNLIEVIIESEDNLIYKENSWLVDCIKSVVRESEYTLGIYFWILKSEKEFEHYNICKVFKPDGEHILNNEEGDDLSTVMDNAPFFNSLFYDEYLDPEVFPDLLAKFLLWNSSSSRD